MTPAASLALSTADVVLSVGARWNETFRFGAELASTAKLIQIDIHAPEIGRGVAPEVGIVGDAKLVLCALVNRLGATDWQPSLEAASWRTRFDWGNCVVRKHLHDVFV